MNVIEIPCNHKMFDKTFSGSFENFIFDDFALWLTKKGNIELGLRVFLECKNGDITGTQIYLVKLHEDWVEDIFYEVELSNETEYGYNVFCNSDDKRYLNIGFDIAELVFKTILYIMNTARNRIVKSKKKTKLLHTNKTKIQSNDKIYLLDDIVEYVNENGFSEFSNEKHIINCPCWSVRGHYRHYKNGKVIFVKSYQKGKEKGKAKPKENIYMI
jgi:hypothetical protein